MSKIKLKKTTKTSHLFLSSFFFMSLALLTSSLFLLARVRSPFTGPAFFLGLRDELSVSSNYTPPPPPLPTLERAENLFRVLLRRRPDSRWVV